MFADSERVFSKAQVKSEVVLKDSEAPGIAKAKTDPHMKKPSTEWADADRRCLSERWKQLELLKEEFKEKFSATNPLLAELTLWCLSYHYEQRPDFLELEAKIREFESGVGPFVSRFFKVGGSRVADAGPAAKAADARREDAGHHQVFGVYLCQER